MSEIVKIRKPRHPRKNGRWYSEGLKFTCQQCAACCSGDPGFVWVTENNIIEIANYLRIGIDKMKSHYIRNAGSGFSLVEMPNGDCIFLRDKKCQIYPVRPVQCTTWPFWKANLESRETWYICCNTCPGGGIGRHYRYSSIEKALLKNSK
jgi:uncharacterized protein